MVSDEPIMNVCMTKRETALFRYLTSRAGEPVSRGDLLREVWGLNPDKTITRTVDMHIAHLRSKLGNRSGGSALLRTIYGVGYMWEEATGGAGVVAPSAGAP